MPAEHLPVNLQNKEKKRITVRFPEEKVDELDELVSKNVHNNRSEAIRRAVYDHLQETQV